MINGLVLPNTHFVQVDKCHDFYTCSIALWIFNWICYSKKQDIPDEYTFSTGEMNSIAALCPEIGNAPLGIHIRQVNTIRHLYIYMPNGETRDYSIFHYPDKESTLLWNQDLVHFEPTTLFWSTQTMHRSYNKESSSDFLSIIDKIRSQMDYNYHGTYKDTRRAFHDMIINRYLKSPTPIMECPHLIFTAGPFGSGKSHKIKAMHEQGLLNLNDYLWLDPDKIKFELPEMAIFIEHDRVNGTRNAGDLTHAESVYIQELIFRMALEQRKNIIVDGSLSNVEWHQYLFRWIKDTYPWYTVEIIEVKALSLEILIERNERRGKETGRYIPVYVLEHQMKEIPQNVKELSHLLDTLYYDTTNKKKVRFAPLRKIHKYYVTDNNNSSHETFYQLVQQHAKNGDETEGPDYFDDLKPDYDCL